MNQKTPIPLLSTRELWKKYVLAEEPLEARFRPNAEAFLITRLEHYRSAIRLPVQPHRRGVHELVLITRGQLRRGCNLHTIEIHPGEVHLLLPGQITTVDYLSDDVQGYYCHFSLETIIRLYHKEYMVSELSALNAGMQTRPVTLPDPVYTSVRNIFERLLEEYHGTHDLNLIDAYLVTLCYEIKNAVRGATETTRCVRSYQITEQFKQLVVTYASRHHSLSFYAAQLNISPNHLNKAVRQTTGRQASALVAEMLVLEARVLLRHTDLSVGEVAFRLGFSEPSYFGRFFRKHTGCTPSAYRMEN